ncbi:hypothetical protein NP233_g12978 [Leucocoprinus birnbaumii]|uniref:WD40 repeat-like protein n=1 Tax=Leucocoprinus birnbaumii TaxID=56174 RepID=A0AAD5VFY2_9AGAR|nr:hypothetical protein NP233_g12978 [Leucocoprinus birnbaumii]
MKPATETMEAPAGDRLASGGDDCQISVWNIGAVEARGLDPAWTAHVPEHGAVCSCTWASLSTGRGPFFLIFSCVDGSIHVYRQVDGGVFEFVLKTISHTGAIEDLAFDPIHNRLASVGDSRLILWNVGPQGALTQFIETQPSESTARSVCFLDAGTAVLVSFLHSREVIIYNIDPWRRKGYYTLPTRIGFAALGCLQRTLLVSNLATGIDVYDLPPLKDSKPIRMFRHVIRKNVPLLVVSALGDSLAFAGSDDGSVRVFDQQTGSLITTLRHGPIGTLVQVVDAVSIDGGKCIIASATSDERETSFDLKIWSTEIHQLALN